MATRVVINPAFLAKAPLLPGVQAVLDAKAENVAENARGFAPEDTGDYIDSIEVVDGEVPGSKRVQATDFKSSWIEFGTENMPAFAPLRLGADAAGIILTNTED